jgi:hypothetical protein
MGKKKCTCRFGVFNGDYQNPRLMRHGNLGCKLHCTHPGIMPGGKCPCGAILRDGPCTHRGIMLGGKCACGKTVV